MSSAILSVEMTPEGHCGEIRIICANQQYRELMGPAYHDGMLYQELVPQDPKFEDFCFRAAHKNQRMHAYVEAKAFDGWADQAFIALSGVFRKDDLFRPGGDEFVVIADGMVSDAFQARVERIRNRAAKLSDVSLAIGSYWSDGSTDVHEAFRLADEDMYADKQSYYDSHPEARR